LPGATQTTDYSGIFRNAPFGLELAKWSGMTRDESRLVRHLAIAILVKLALLVALWWVFVRDHRVDADRAASQISANVPIPP
jgi:hypothetical protein